MKDTWFDKFILSLEKLIEKPPYLIFVFIGSIFLVISLITKFNYDKSFIFLIYSTGGMVWRYIEKDIMRSLESKKLLIKIIYHIGNIIIFIILLHYLFS
jgi:hypothetical protein